MPVCLDGLAAGGTGIAAFQNGEVRQGLRSRTHPQRPIHRRRQTSV